MTIVDVHAHHVDPRSLDDMRSVEASRAPACSISGDECTLLYDDGRRLGPFPAGLVSTPRRLASMAEQGVDVQIVSVPPALFGYEHAPEVGAAFARTLNEGLLRLADDEPTRFGVFATLPLQDVAASIDEIERCSSQRSVVGVEIGTHVLGRNLGDRLLEPVWDALEFHRLAVLVHPDQRFVAGGERLSAHYLNNFVGNPMESTIAVASLLFGGVVSRHPSLRFCFVHGGGFAPYQLGRWDHGWSHRSEARTDLTVPPTEDFARLHFDSLTHDSEALSFLVERAGTGHVVLGSDFPYDMSEQDPVGALGKLPGDAGHRILHENWRTLLDAERIDPRWGSGGTR